MNNPSALRSAELSLGEHVFTWGKRTYVMGILNITADSFSGDGLLKSDDVVAAALSRARAFESAGVDILDIGGESTRPGSEAVDADMEAKRVVPIVAAVAEACHTVISIDTSKTTVADAALDAGAHMVNDVWALRADRDMAKLVADRHVPIVLMHNRITPNSAQLSERLGGRYVGVDYDDLLEDVKHELLESVDTALAAGVPEEHILLDPGIGFGKTTAQSLELVDRLDIIRQLGYPVLVGPSRKSFIGFTLDLPTDDRLEGTAAAVAVAIARGADIIRVHDVGPMIRVARMTDALVRRDPTKGL